MNIRLVFPTQENEKKVLQDRIDILHCHMIFATLNELDLPYEEKILILEETQSIIATKDFDSNWMNHCNHPKAS